jgi:hypothetical protein
MAAVLSVHDACVMHCLRQTNAQDVQQGLQGALLIGQLSGLAGVETEFGWVTTSVNFSFDSCC